jgi:hypothetical protein
MLVGSDSAASRAGLHAPHRFSVAEFSSISTVDRVELIDGVVYDVPPRNDAHRIAVNALIKAFKKLDDGFVLQVQDPVRLAGWDGPHAPEIDIAVFRETGPGLLPAVGDAVAFIEVSDTTYRYDRDRKIPLYIAADVPAWIVNISNRWMESYRSPADLERPNGVVYGRGEVEIAGVSIELSRLFVPKT